MSFNVSGLSTYTDEVSGELIAKAVLVGNTVDRVSIQPGIKGSQTLNLLDNTLVLQAAACGFNTSGSVNLTQRTLTVSGIKVNETLCPADLDNYFLGQKLRPGSINDNVPEEEKIVDKYVKEIQSANEALIWRGNTSSTNPNLARATGLLQIVSASYAASEGVLVPNASTGSITLSNVDDKVEAMVDNIPTAIMEQEDLTLFVPYSVFNLYVQKLRNDNLFHYPTATAGEFEMMIPGVAAKVQLVATAGLNSTSAMVLSSAKNLFVGTDLLDETDNLRMWYSEDNDEVRFRANYKLGTQVAYPDFVVWNGTIS